MSAPSSPGVTAPSDVYVKQYAVPAAKVAEVADLHLLRSALSAAKADGLLKIPAVVAEPSDATTLALERVGTVATHKAQASQRLGVGLALLHRHPADVGSGAFGLDRDNYIGLNVQRNAWVPSWGQFFVDYRLRPQVEMLEDAALRVELTDALSTHESAVVTFLSERALGAPDHPAVVHGDLWGGNVLLDQEGQPWLIDPAAFVGDREVDLAMSEMFSGFDKAFYEAYDAAYPRSAHYRLKKDLYNGYHYLNHVNVFGHGYVDGCRRMVAAMEQISQLVATFEPSMTAAIMPQP